MGSTSLPSTLSPSNTACDSVPAWISPSFPCALPTWLLCNKQPIQSLHLEIRSMLTGKKKDQPAPEASNENVKGLPSRMVPLGRDEGWSAGLMQNINRAPFMHCIITESPHFTKIWLSVPPVRCKHEQIMVKCKYYAPCSTKWAWSWTNPRGSRSLGRGSKISAESWVMLCSRVRATQKACLTTKVAFIKSRARYHL